jgi:hypothetical protein
MQHYLRGIRQKWGGKKGMLNFCVKIFPNKGKELKLVVFGPSITQRNELLEKK